MHELQEWLFALDGITLYGALFALFLGGAFGLPIPEDIPLILGGILIQLGRSHPALIFVVCYFSIVLGDLIIFSMGRWLGPAVFRRKWLSTPRARARVRRIRLGLERRSIIMIFVARHLFYIRTLTFLTCGAFKMRFSRFLLADCIAALVSVPLMLSVGYFAANNLNLVTALLREAKIGALILVAIVFVLFLIRRALRREVEPEPEELGEPPSATTDLSELK